MIVIDCSYTLAMVMPDEQQPATLQRAAASRLLVPSIWPYEVANAFRSAVRRGRLADAHIVAVCARLEGLQIELPGGQDASVRQRYLAAAVHDLTAYDAAYLDLALQRRCPLATLDRSLAQVAARAGIEIIH